MTPYISGKIIIGGLPFDYTTRKRLGKAEYLAGRGRTARRRLPRHDHGHADGVPVRRGGDRLQRFRAGAGKDQPALCAGRRAKSRREGGNDIPAGRRDRGTGHAHHPQKESPGGRRDGRRLVGRGGGFARAEPPLCRAHAGGAGKALGGGGLGRALLRARRHSFGHRAR